MLDFGADLSSPRRPPFRRSVASGHRVERPHELWAVSLLLIQYTRGSTQAIPVLARALKVGKWARCDVSRVKQPGTLADPKKKENCMLALPFVHPKHGQVPFFCQTPLTGGSLHDRGECIRFYEYYRPKLQIEVIESGDRGFVPIAGGEPPDGP
ncbi:hypothetical protein BU16DRAFT_600521 [Lophium mytilinum]|uniref:Uncharacterized protein n=1 Tax=Lophium mytilinum TaxID=390894 RepID=A0A6A6Q973_9PEZI|nr:hypothetical protein BU16DRAFT_600521 [Lophium mytilinum]